MLIDQKSFLEAAINNELKSWNYRKIRGTNTSWTEKSDKIFKSALIKLLFLPLSFFLPFYEDKQNLRGTIYSKLVKLKTIGQGKKYFY
jgi:hypothetical protein